MFAAQLDYALPEALIAQAPLPDRDGARLLCLSSAKDRGPDFAAESALAHRQVLDLPELVRSALIVVNDTRVIPARLFGHKPSGGRVELLLVERIGGDGKAERWWCMGRASKGLKPGTVVQLADGFSAEILSRPREDRLVEVRLHAQDVPAAIEAHGHMPLPPYIERAAAAQDGERYQTVYAKEAGAVAAPTAGLHLSEALIERLEAAGNRFASVTLHVGPGTFAPLRSENLADHPMHAERYTVPEGTAAAIAQAHAEGRPVLAVGTTVVRALEAAAARDGVVQPGAGETDIFIYPPYKFRVVDMLLTNFHLPKSTLLALVMAFAGQEATRVAYEAAVAGQYRFFSYGDAMLIGRQP